MLTHKFSHLTNTFMNVDVRSYRYVWVCLWNSNAETVSVVLLFDCLIDRTSEQLNLCMSSRRVLTCTCQSCRSCFDWCFVIRSTDSLCLRAPQTSAAGAAEAGRGPPREIPSTAHLRLTAESGQGSNHRGLRHPGQLPGQLRGDAGCRTGRFSRGDALCGVHNLHNSLWGLSTQVISQNVYTKHK